MFRVFLTNFGFVHSEHETYKDAVDTARRVCFQSVIYNGDEPIASFCPISGVKKVLAFIPETA